MRVEKPKKLKILHNFSANFKPDFLAKNKKIMITLP